MSLGVVLCGVGFFGVFFSVGWEHACVVLGFLVWFFFSGGGGTCLHVCVFAGRLGGGGGGGLLSVGFAGFLPA